MKNLFNLQLFAEGSAGAGANGSGSSGAEASTGTGAVPGGEGLNHVIYGKATGEVANPKGKSANNPETLEARFEDMIKGEFKDVFAKRTQGIIDERFKKTKGLEEKLKSMDPILSILSEKYGTDANDINALTKAIKEDDSYFQKAAMEAGLTVAQYKEVYELKQRDKELTAQLEARQQQEATEQIFAEWANQAQEFAGKYQIEGFDLGAELENPEFAKLLGSGVTVEGAYKAVHFDDMVGGAMAHTAAKVKEDLVNSINSRASRPSEGAITSHSATTFKSDVNALTKADREEIERRAARGEIISF